MLLIYGPVLWFDFTLDDFAVIVRNDTVHHWSGLWRSWAMSYWPASEGGFDSGLYRPLMGRIFTLLWQVGQGAAWPFHAATVLLHTAVTLGTWWWLRRFTGDLPAAVGAAWFALHPSRIEAVASAVGMAEVLVAAWVVLAVHVATRPPSPTGERWRGWRRPLALAACYLGATATKESGLLLPVLVWLAWAATQPSGWPQVWAWRALWQRWGAPWVRPALLWVGVALAMGLLRWWVAPSLTIAGVDGLVRLSPVARLWTMMQTWPAVVGALFVPWWALHAHVVDQSMVPLMVRPSLRIAAIGLAARAWLLGALWLAWRHRRLPLAATAWVVMAALPASNLFIATTQLFSERTLYTAGLARAGVVAGLAAVLVARRPVGTQAVAFLALAGLALAGQAWLLEWRSNATLFAGAVVRHPARPVAWHHWAREQATAGDLPGARVSNGVARRLWRSREDLWHDAVRFAAAAADRSPRAVALVDSARRQFPADFQLELLELTWRHAAVGMEDAVAAVDRGVGRHAPVALWLRTTWLLEGHARCRARARWQDGIRRYPHDPGLRTLGEAHATLLQAADDPAECRAQRGEIPERGTGAAHAQPVKR